MTAPVSPTASVDPARTRNAKLLSALVVVMFAVFAIADLGSWLTRPGYEPPWYGYVLLGAAWLLNRTGRYPLAAGLTLASVPVTLLWQAAAQSGAEARDTLSYLVIGVLLAGLLLTARGTLLFSAGCVLGIGLLPLFAPGVLSSPGEFVSPVALVVVGAALAATAIVHRDRIERDRQALLREGEERRRQLEQQLVQAQKMEAIGRLAGGVAHDFNNLLMVIINSTAVALADRTLTARVRQHLEAVGDAGESAAKLSRQLLAFSRRQVLQPVVLDLNALVGRIERLLRRVVGEDIELEVRPGADLWPVYADPSQMEQVIVNLATNARDAMSRGGRLTIETGNTRCDDPRLHPDASPVEYARLVVKDDGVGMDAATLSRIFEPFFTTKGDRGTGLGLSTVHGIVRQSGGQIRVQSEPGRGTTFEIFVPRCNTGEAVSGPRPEPVPPAPGEEKRLA